MPVTRAMAAMQAVTNDKPAQEKPIKRSPRKRAKISGPATNRRKKARLGRLMDMPPEVFTEIVTHLLPMDILSLARSNKFFRNMFMSRASKHLWKRALENLPDLPPCPSHLSEPHYVSLLFSKTCSNCGTRILRRMDPYLYVRFCNPCCRLKLTELSLFNPLLLYLPKTDRIAQCRSGYAYTLHSEVVKLREAADKDFETFKEWQNERVIEMDERHELSASLEAYLSILEEERETEIEDLKMQRRNQIETRLLKEGWTQRDMRPSPNSKAEWLKLVSQPKPVTDRVWANLYPKLEPLVRSNRAHNDHIDRAQRRRARITKLHDLGDSIRLSLPPLVHITLKSTLQGDRTAESGTSSTHLPINSAYPDTKIDQPFPTMAELLTWPMIKNIVDDDVSPEDAGIKFESIRGEFDQAVMEWREKIERDLVEIWNVGVDRDEQDEDKSKSSTRKGKGKATRQSNSRKSKGRIVSDNESTLEVLKLDLPEFVTTFTKPDGTTTTSLSDLHSNLQLLLRADTVFKSAKHIISHTYPGMVPHAAPLTTVFVYEELMRSERWDAGPIQRDDDGSAVAKAMLALIGRSEATSAEMQALDCGTFLCGRCYLTSIDSWDCLVLHYKTEYNRWKQAQEKIKAEPSAGFVYNHTHDLETQNPKPFIQFLGPQDGSDYVLKQATYAPTMMICVRCEEMGIEARYFQPFNREARDPLKEHLCDVHGVVEARIGFDFRRWEDSFDPFESDEEGYDSEGGASLNL